jgi:DNA repair exonuclease SbcCD ATPase subunit
MADPVEVLRDYSGWAKSVREAKRIGIVDVPGPQIDPDTIDAVLARLMDEAHDHALLMHAIRNKPRTHICIEHELSLQLQRAQRDLDRKDHECADLKARLVDAEREPEELAWRLDEVEQDRDDLRREITEVRESLRRAGVVGAQHLSRADAAEAREKSLREALVRYVDDDGPCEYGGLEDCPGTPSFAPCRLHQARAALVSAEPQP